MTKTLEEVKAEVKQLVLENPLNYAECRYTNKYWSHTQAIEPTAPVCIVGHWAHKYQGLSLDLLATFEETSIDSRLAAPGGPLSKGVVITSEALNFLSRFQDLQDAGEAWGYVWNELVPDDLIDMTQYEEKAAND